MDKAQAMKNFSSGKIKSDLLPEWQLGDIDDIMSELQKNAFVGCFSADNFTAFEAWLTSEGFFIWSLDFKKKAK